VAELLWRGKYRDGTLVQPSRAGLAIHTDEVHAAEGRSEPWLNRLVLGDHADVLPGLAGDFAGKVSLVYVDPPFDTGGDFAFQASIPGAPDGVPRIAIPAYEDARGLDDWLASFHGASVLLRDLLEDGGSLYVHLDAHVAHYAKVMLDEVFGPGAFQREIVWRIGWVSGFKSRARAWIRNHDTLLFYAKGGRPRTFHKEYIPYPPGYVRRDGKPPRGAGYPIEDVWNGSDVDRMDSIQIMSFSGEKVGYPTQKNEALVARILRASSRPGDLILDCFVGSGTTAVVAEKLGRRWVACDASPIAIHTTRKRLLRLPRLEPMAVQHAGEASVELPPRRRRRSARAIGAVIAVDGRSATIELASFVLPMRDVPIPTRARVAHWSQWLDGWCIDWDHRGGPMNAGARFWRATGRTPLPLRATHAYGSAGRYVVLVKAFDVLGGATTKMIDVVVGSS
jgi:adenine-specific DNA-methyltransferase